MKPFISLWGGIHASFKDSSHQEGPEHSTLQALPQLLKLGFLMHCFNLALEEQTREGSHMKRTVASPSLTSLPQRKTKTVTILYGNLLEDSFSCNGNLEEVLKHSYGIRIADIPPSNRLDDSLLVALQRCLHCHCMIEKKGCIQL